jgi:hypothetical protein
MVPVPAAVVIMISAAAPAMVAIVMSVAVVSLFVILRPAWSASFGIIISSATGKCNDHGEGHRKMENVFFHVWFFRGVLKISCRCKQAVFYWLSFKNCQPGFFSRKDVKRNSRKDAKGNSGKDAKKGSRKDAKKK